MADDPQFPKNEDEYKFAVDEQPEEMGDQLPKSSFLKKLFSNRRFLLFLVIIIAVFVVYLFLGRQTTVRQEVTQFEQKALQPMEPAPVQTPPAPVAPVATVPESTEISTMQQQLNTISQQTQQNQNQIQQMQNTMQQLQTTVNQMTNQVATVSATIDSLAARMKPAAKSIVKVKKTPPRPVYQVRAIVPGRAWLQEKKGQHIVKLLTVKVGDLLPGYGRVKAINPTEGQVLTSWGTVIYYARDN